MSGFRIRLYNVIIDITSVRRQQKCLPGSWMCREEYTQGTWPLIVGSSCCRCKSSDKFN